MENTEIIETPPTKSSRLKNFFNKFKVFLSTRRGKIILGFGIFLTCALIIGIVFFVSKNNQKSGVTVSETIASDKIYDNYDFIYNSEDNKLIASTTDGANQLEILRGDAQILDYIISPDKKKIAYTLSDVDYKNKIHSSNVDITKFDFSPVPFSLYELNLETGENHLIWEIESIELGSTNQQLYNRKLMIMPDRYLVDWNYYDEFGYPLSAPVSYTYPVSYMDYVDDVEAGYNTKYLPYDLSGELRLHNIKVMTYNSQSNNLIFSIKDKLVIFDNQNKNLTENSTNLISGPYCTTYSEKWINDILHVSSSCMGHTAWSRYFRITDTSIEEISTSIGGSSNLVFLTDTFSIFTNQMGYGTNEDTGAALYKFDLNSSITKIRDLVNNQHYLNMEVLNSNVIYLISAIRNEQYTNNSIYKIEIYNPDTGTLEIIVDDIELPPDLTDFAFNPENNTLSFFRRYTARTESIVEYKTINLETKIETQLLDIKLSNNSVLVYKPKLVWLNQNL